MSIKNKVELVNNLKDKILFFNSRLYKILKVNTLNIYAFEYVQNKEFIFDVSLMFYSVGDKVAYYNFFIEFKGYGKPSGISTTEADYYIINDTINYYLISVDKLKLLVENMKIISTKDKLTFGYLIKSQIIKDNSLILISSYHI